jgi:hypothetical protein
MAIPELRAERVSPVCPRRHGKRQDTQASRYKLAGIGSTAFTPLAGKLYQGADVLVNGECNTTGGSAAAMFL